MVSHDIISVNTIVPESGRRNEVDGCSRGLRLGVRVRVGATRASADADFAMLCPGARPCHGSLTRPGIDLPSNILLLVQRPVPLRASRTPISSRRRVVLSYHRRKKSSSRVIVQTAEAVRHPKASMCRDPRPRARTRLHPTRKRVLHHLVKHGVITPRSRQAEALRIILMLPPRYLRVTAIAAVLSISRRTCTRLFGSAGLPSPQAWIGLVRALHTHRAIPKGRTLKDAAAAGGCPDQFTMSNALLLPALRSRRAVLRHRAGRTVHIPEHVRHDVRKVCGDPGTPRFTRPAATHVPALSRGLATDLPDQGYPNGALEAGSKQWSV